MIYVDRNGNRTKGTTGQDRLLKFIYTHTATRLDPSFSQSLGIKAWRNVSEYKTFCSGNPSIC